MSLRRGQLSTIYSVGEGRTIVFAADGCRRCVQAFSILVGSASSSGREDPRQREQSCNGLGMRAQGLQRSGSANLEGIKGYQAVSRPPKSGQDWNGKLGQARRRTPQLNVGDLDLAAQTSGDALSPSDSQAKVPAPNPGHLVVLDAEVPEEDREEQELTLRASDRLILALYNPPGHGSSQLPLDTPSPKHDSRSRSFKLPGLHAPHLPSAIGGLLGIKKHPKPPEPRAAKSEKEHSPPLASPKQSGPKAEKPKEGPGHTTIFMHMTAWEDVLHAVDQWEGATLRECLVKMAQAARDAKVRFEAIRVEGQLSPHEKECQGEQGRGAGGVPSDTVGPTQKHSVALGQSLNTFCEQVEAKLLILGTHHSLPADVNPKAFSRHLTEYCAEHCRCSVRIVAQNQLKGQAEQSPRDKGAREAPKPPRTHQ